MNIYAIYVNPEKEEATFVSVRQGFSLTAAIFNILWALYHKMWRIILFTMLVEYLISFISTTNPPIFSPIIHLAIMLAFGFFATDMQEYELQRKGYKLKDIVLAPSEQEAELKFLATQNF